MGVRSLLARVARAFVGPPEPPVPTVDDPTFGRLEHFDGSWSGCDAVLPSIPPWPLFVTLPGGPEGPSAEGRGLFDEIVRRLPELNAQVEGALFEDYGLLRDHARVRGEGLPEVRAPADVWLVANVTSIWLVVPQGERPADFEVDYGTAWDDDHRFVALYKDWGLVELRKDG